MASEVILPRVDMDMATGKISKWLAEPGAMVAKGQPLFEIETDKAAMEIEAPAAGTLRTLVDASGEDIPVGSTVAWICAEGEDMPSAKKTPPAETASSSAAPASAAPDAGRLEAEDRSFDSALPVDTRERTAPASQVPASPPPMGERPRATPLARRLAREQGLDLGSLTGSGPRGRIQAEDIGNARGPARTAPPAAATPTPTRGEAAPALQARSVDRAGGSLNIVQLRAGSGTPTLLVHGWGADANGWRPFLAGQAPGRPVLALDLPGHGASRLGPVSRFDDLVDAIEAALLEAALEPVHVVAHSLGAAAMAAVAARHSLDLRSLLLLAPAGLGPSINAAFLGGFLAATSEASLTPWMHELVADPAAISGAFVRATLKARDGTALVATQRRVAEAVFPDGTQAFSIRADLARLAVPTRVVLGDADRIVPCGQARGLPGIIATHHFPNVGHMPQFEVRDSVQLIAEQMASH